MQEYGEERHSACRKKHSEGLLLLTDNTLRGKQHDLLLKKERKAKENNSESQASCVLKYGEEQAVMNILVFYIIILSIML